jgi:hypothetical protein
VNDEQVNMIVTHTPRTRDGKPIVLGSVVYVYGGYAIVWKIYIGNDGNKWVGLGTCVNSDGEAPVHDCYSTREACAVMCDYQI